ncbi:MAG TPA: S1 family peptidase [Polyangiaceae bacterium]|nr:S1 family peptidase [Polyangiaceae bacterium]
MFGKRAYTFGQQMVLQKQRASSKALLSLLLLGLAGCSSAPAERVVTDRQAIVGGELDSEHTNVFGLITQEGDAVGACSATLIAPNLLLTARHCVSMDVNKAVICGRSGLGEVHPAADVFASNDTPVGSDSNWFRASELHVPSEGDDTCGFDVALVILSENVPEGVATPAVPRIDRDVLEGEPYVAVGYGLANEGHFGSRRVREGLQVECDPGSCGSGVTGGEFRGETGVCEGDSGGPAFDADGKVVGVVSRGGEECSTPVYTTVTAWRDLIAEVATHAADVGGYQAPFWVKSGMSDPPVVVPPPKVKAKPGEVCRAADECVAGSACYQPPAAGDPFCVALCEDDAVCRAGEQCVAVDGSDVKACLITSAPPGGPSSSCALGRPASGNRGAPWAALALGVSLTFARRRAGRRAAR